MIQPLGNQFDVNDRGGEYYEKLRNIHTRLSEVISDFNKLSANHATAAQGALAETAHAQRLWWDGSASALTNPAVGRASLQLGSSATRPATDFATASQGSLAQSAMQPGSFTVVGNAFRQIATPTAERFTRINANGSLSLLSASELLSTLGGSSISNAVVANVNDMTTGRLVTVGWAGHGTNSLLVPNVGVTDNSLLSGGIYRYSPDSTTETTVGGPGNIGWSHMFHMRRSNGGESQIYAVEGLTAGTPVGRGKRPGTLVTRSRIGGAWSTPLWQLTDADLTTDINDVTSNRILTTGWMGHGVCIKLGVADDMLNLPQRAGITNQFFAWDFGAQPANTPVSAAGYALRFCNGSTFERLTVYLRDNHEVWENIKTSGNWLGWKKGGGGGGSAEMEVIDLGEVATTAAATVVMDLSQGNKFLMSTETANTTGDLTLSFTNIPASGNVDGFLIIRRAGRKRSVVLPSGSKWASGVTPIFLTTTNSHAVIHFSRLAHYSPGTFVFTVNQAETRP